MGGEGATSAATAVSDILSILGTSTTTLMGIPIVAAALALPFTRQIISLVKKLFKKG